MSQSPLDVILVPALMILLGYVVKRLGILKAKDSYTLNEIVLKISMPSLIFSNLISAQIDISMALLPIISILISLSGAILGFIFAKVRGMSKKDMWTIIIACAMINSGFIGYPIVLGVFGHLGFIRAIFFDLSTTIVFVLFGVILLWVFGGTMKDVGKSVLTFVPLWAVIFGLLLNILNIQIGTTLMSTFTYLGNATVPLIMLSLGLALDFKEVKAHFGTACYTSFVRLIIAPVIAFAFVLLFHVNGLNANVAILESAMSTAMITLVLSITYKLDISLMTACIFTSTIFSLITLPILIGIL